MKGNTWALTKVVGVVAVTVIAVAVFASIYLEHIGEADEEPELSGNLEPADVETVVQHSQVGVNWKVLNVGGVGDSACFEVALYTHEGFELAFNRTQYVVMNAGGPIEYVEWWDVEPDDPRQFRPSVKEVPRSRCGQ